jgi:hypothetical protein
MWLEYTPTCAQICVHTHTYTDMHNHIPVLINLREAHRPENWRDMTCLRPWKDVTFLSGHSQYQRSPFL